MLRIGLIAAMAVGALALGPGVAGASVSPTYSVSGAEYSATSTEVKFTGRAHGSSGDTALWNADVQHAPLSSSSSPARRAAPSPEDRSSS